MICGDRSGRNIGNFTFTDGQMVYGDKGDPIEFFVNSKGGFKLVIPIEAGGFSGGSGMFTANKDTLIISASLQAGKGNFLMSSADLGGAGCNLSVSFEKQGA